MHPDLRRYLEGAVQALAFRAADTAAFIEEHATWFVLVVEHGESALRFTHYWDHLNGLVVVHGALADPLEAGDALAVSLMAGPLRMAVSDEGESCWRADYDPAWNGDETFARGVLQAACAVTASYEFQPAPTLDLPVAVHAADALETRSDSVEVDVAVIDGWLLRVHGQMLRFEERAWSLDLGGRQCTLTAQKGALRLWYRLRDGWSDDFSRGALKNNYHARFFKLALDEGREAVFALDVPDGIPFGAFEFLFRAFPVYLDGALQRINYLTT